MTNPATLGEALPQEMARVRDEVLPGYYAVVKMAPMTQITINLMRASLDRAATALAQGDVVAMLNAYNELREWEQ